MLSFRTDQEEVANGSAGRNGVSRAAAVYLVFVAVLAGFVYGTAMTKFHIFPYSFLSGAVSAALDWQDNYKQYLHIRPIKHLRKAVHDGNGVVMYDEERAVEGLTYLTVFDQKLPAILLIDMAGRIRHRWDLSYTRFWPSSDHLPILLDDWDTQIHGAVYYRNGDVVFNFEHGGTVRVDRCGREIWKISWDTHHAVFEAQDGHLWVTARRHHDAALERFPLLSPPFKEDHVLEVSPEDGEILREISVVELIYRNRLLGLIQSRLGMEGNSKNKDFLHLNDVEVLSDELAPAFPMFTPGDVMISIRNINTIMVFDPNTLRVKWWITGAFIRQHDPDFRPDGTITLFDNNDGDNRHAFGGSRILAIDPATRTVRTVLESSPELFFYTEEIGNQQTLPGGNLLITESRRGRAFEVTPEGDVVWSYISRYDERDIETITEATRVPSAWPRFQGEACPS